MKPHITVLESMSVQHNNEEMLLEDFKVKEQQLEKVTSVTKELTNQVPNAEKMLSIGRIGLVTVAGIVSEVIEDISRFKDPKKIQKYV